MVDVYCERCKAEVKVWSSFPPRQSLTVPELEAEMARVQNLMEELARERTRLRRRINSLSPTTRLPPEIITDIFRMACEPMESTIEDAQHNNTVLTPLFFGKICGEWREIAWSTPLLWSSISLHVSRKAHNAQIELLEEWLARAGTSSLSIKLTSDDEHESIFYSLRAIMDVLVTRSMHWGSLDCLLPPQCHDILANNHFPNLTSVSVRPPKGTISTFSHPPDMFRSAPRLCAVDLSGYDFSSMVLPWDQLKQFRTQFLTVAECVKILRRSPSLESCHLENVYSPDIFPPPTSQILHSQLKQLAVTLIKGAAMSLLNTISLPAIRDIKLHYSGTEFVSLRPLISLVSRSSCHLQRLCIERSIFAEDDLLRCLEVIPTLTELRLAVLSWSTETSIGLSEKFLTKLCPSEMDEEYPPDVLLPHLKHFDYEGPISCPSQALAAMLEWRWHRSTTSSSAGSTPISVARLQSVRIVSPAAYEVDTNAISSLTSLHKFGMDLGIMAAGVALI